MLSAFVREWFLSGKKMTVASAVSAQSLGVVPLDMSGPIQKNVK